MPTQALLHVYQKLSDLKITWFDTHWIWIGIQMTGFDVLYRFSDTPLILNVFPFINDSVLPTSWCHILCPRLAQFYSYLLVSILSFCVGQITFLIVLRIIYNYFLCVYSSVGDSDIASAVIDESVAEGEEARKFLEDVNVTYPQVCLLNMPSSFSLILF